MQDGEKGGKEVLRRGGISTHALQACLGPYLKITVNALENGPSRSFLETPRPIFDK